MGRRRLFLPCALIALLLSTVNVTLAAPPLLASRIQVEIEHSSELNDNWDIPGDELVFYLPAVRDFATRIADVRYAPTLRIAAFGITMCSPQTQKCMMLISEGLSVNMQIATLFHELAHIRLGAFARTTEESEILAETTAYLAMENLGFNCRQQSIAYLKRFNSRVLEKTLMKREKEIREAADLLAKIARGEAQ